jgi:iron complex outermembrane recepter protein
MKKFICLLIVASAWNYACAQSISGKITGSSSEGIPRVSIQVLNTHLGAISDNDGNFSINSIPTGNYHIQITAVGYASITKNITVGEAGTGTGNVSFQLKESAQQLDDVIVTAQKKEENQQLVPVSISSISSKQVLEYRLWNSKDLTAIVPNLFSSNPGDGRNVTSVRGITSTSYDPAVATYIDGVNQFGLDTYIAQLFDVERIEVLRGPQGTLYGRNAMGGVINIITRQPTNRTDGFTEVNAGNYGQQRYAVALRTPLVKGKLFLGVSGVYDYSDGFYKNTNPGSDPKFDKKHSLTGNYYLKFLASPRWALTLNLKHNQNRNNGAFTLVSSKDEALQHPFEISQNATTQMIDNIFNTSLSIAHTGSNFNFTSQTGYQSNYRYYLNPIDGDFSSADIVSIINNYGKKWNNVKVWTQEFKFTSPSTSSGPFNWTAGTYLFYQNSPVKQATRFGNDAGLYGIPDSNFSTISTGKGKSMGAAAFGQATYRLTERVDLLAGLRYDYEQKKQSVFGEYQHDPDPNPAFVTRPDTSATASFSAFSPKFGGIYHATENSNLFLTYSRGYRTGGFTQLSSDPSQPPLYSYKPEYSGNFELSSKNVFLDNRLRVNITAFYVNITDAQVPTLVLPSALTITKNAGKLTSQGLELELSSTPVKGLQIDYNAGVNKAVYKTLNLSQNGQEVNLAGKRQIFTSPVTSMLATQYALAFGKTGGRLIARVEWMYLDKKYFDLANTVSQSAYHLFNARVSYALKGFEVSLWARNLANKKYIDFAYDFGAVHLGNPRNYGVTVRKNF